MPAPVLTPRSFRKALEQRAFAPVYLFHGSDDFRKEQAVRDLVDASVDAATRDFNLETRRSSELDAETLGSLLGTPPMMAERRVVVLRDANLLKKDARRALDSYLERPAADAIAVLVIASGTKPDRSLLDASASLSLEPLTGEHITKWIAHYAATELGGSITPDAADLLHSAVGTDLAQLAAELDKLLSYTGGGEITEQAVGDIVGIRRGETLGDLLDAIAMRDAPLALSLVKHVMNQPKVSGVGIVMALTVQTLAIAWAQAARAEGLSASRLDGELFTLLKESGAFPHRPWGEAVRCWSRAVPRWRAAELDRALASLLAADIALKETSVSSDEQIVTSLILALCAAGTHSAAA